jgi:hypothetical protein
MFQSPTTSGRILQVGVQDNYRINKILIADGHGGTRDYKIIVNNNTGSNKTFKLDKNNLTYAKVSSLKVPTVTNYATATSATAVADIRFDSSFPTGGSDTSYTVTPSGFIMFDLTFHAVSIGGSTGTALFSNLQTAAI